MKICIQEGNNDRSREILPLRKGKTGYKHCSSNMIASVIIAKELNSKQTGKASSLGYPPKITI